MRRAATTIALVLLTGCSDLLGGVGDFSRGVVYGDEPRIAPTTTVVSDGPALRLTGVTEVAWTNDDVGPDTVGLEGVELLSAIWTRSDGVTPFIQASRREIAAALPGIAFPQLVPEQVTHVSSQLIFDVQSVVLDPTTAAAFGLWVGEPYERPRTEAQLVVLRVGLRAVGDPEPGEFFEFQVSEGREITWTEHDYVYQLFCRTGVGQSACIAIAESLFPLHAMLST
ncbi:MAG TPA: hypothetical protein VMM81_05895 [Acidimicrobiia bacterium]|nr:hypothetical protein [Acidimicrobiia bacterium]